MKVFFWIVFMLSLCTSPMIIDDLVNVNVREYVGWEWLFVIISFSLSIAGFVYLLKGRWFEKINQKQKIILAIFIPIIIFFIALIVANSLGYTAITKALPDDSVWRIFGETTRPYFVKGNPFDWGRTWHIWLLALVFCCIFEYKLFEDKKR